MLHRLAGSIGQYDWMGDNLPALEIKRDEPLPMRESFERRIAGRGRGGRRLKLLEAGEVRLGFRPQKCDPAS